MTETLQPDSSHLPSYLAGTPAFSVYWAGISALTILLVSALATAVVPRSFRRCFLVIRYAKWLVPLCRCIAFPVAVTLKRFLIPLCVFCLGIVPSTTNSRLIVTEITTK